MENKNIQLIKSYFNHFLQGETEEVFKMLSEDIIWSVKGSDNVPTVGQRKGKREIELFLSKFHANFQPKEFNIQYYFEQNDRVFAIGNFRHLVISTQSVVESDFMIEFIIKNEKICSYKILEDSYALYLAFS